MRIFSPSSPSVSLMMRGDHAPWDVPSARGLRNKGPLAGGWDSARSLLRDFWRGRLRRGSGARNGQRRPAGHPGLIRPGSVGIFWLVLTLALAQRFLYQVFDLPLSLFEPFLVLVVREAFFHSFQIRRYLFLSFLCGLLSDLAGADVFGSHMFAYAMCAVITAQAATFLYRQDRRLVFALVFAAVFLHHHILLFLKMFFLPPASTFHYGIFFFKTFLEAAGSIGLAWLLERFFEPCAPESTS